MINQMKEMKQAKHSQTTVHLKTQTAQTGLQEKI
jgi:hypothetical protein